MKGQLHTSYRLLKRHFHDVFGFDVSTGYLTKQIRKVSQALKVPYEELSQQLVAESHLYMRRNTSCLLMWI
ncbi:hypothetical protein FACS189454_06120 [Planctomycetales bacterium]|nr:hypothetical protein FACS189454_06120 [Planctomycetales bacterium]